MTEWVEAETEGRSSRWLPVSVFFWGGWDLEGVGVGRVADKGIFSSLFFSHYPSLSFHSLLLRHLLNSAQT